MWKVKQAFKQSKPLLNAQLSNFTETPGEEQAVYLPVLLYICILRGLHL